MRTLLCASVCLSTLAASLAVADPAPVVGGTRVPNGSWRDVVAVLGPTGACTGTLIAPDVVLTAGHCIDLEPTHVIAGSVDYGAPGGDRIDVKWARAYPDWWDRYDIGVLMLEHVARGTPRPIATACLANERLAEGAPLTIVGFGLTTPAGSDHNTRLHAATIPVLDAFCASDPTCNAQVRPNGELTAGGRGTDSCFGDSGGPAFLDTPDGPALVGVVSRGLALPGAPCGNGGVYVRADKVVAWIRSVTGRKLARAACDGPSDDPERDVDVETDGGCAATGGHGLGLALLFGIAVIRRRRATPAGAARPDPGDAPRGLDPAREAVAERGRSPGSPGAREGAVDPALVAPVDATLIA